MAAPKHHISYPRKQIIEILRTLEELVVSLDRVDNGAEAWDFIIRHKITRKAARARRILSEPFPTTVGPDEMDELEREMQEVPYWRAKKSK